MFQIDLVSFVKNYEGFWLSILAIDTFGSFDRSLFMIGKKDTVWFLDLLYIRILPH